MRTILLAAIVIQTTMSLPVFADPSSPTPDSAGASADVAAVRAREDDYTNGVRTKDLIPFLLIPSSTRVRADKSSVSNSIWTCLKRIAR